jgi:hypothetical protein
MLKRGELTISTFAAANSNNVGLIVVRRCRPGSLAANFAHLHSIFPRLAVFPFLFVDRWKNKQCAGTFGLTVWPSQGKVAVIFSARACLHLVSGWLKQIFFSYWV